ncbi:MAG: UDP-N-acetylglucosamine 1-carboxyvinyltransferase [Oscillospiraceae bacterium]|jgi:UDP-N-acetylglucosamine 1-carboxyvinyltransferase|nr:UDP-N-acetylglucosamine 1-carboxyvinyltransferase [Oscillospiraceae bacterium]
MDKFVIHGGIPLHGEVTISGAKNAAVAIIPAAILSNGPCIIENVPRVSDVSTLVHILRDMGVQVKLLDRTTLEIDASNTILPVVPYDLARRMRGSYYFLGALLGRCSRASVAMPGGCDFGVRPIDQHIKAFEAMNVKVNLDRGMINARAGEASGGLLGGHVYFDSNTVGGTINAMLAAVKAKGVTVLENAAKEPHIVDLANFLNSMGADVRGAGTDVIKIHGVEELHGTAYSIIPDQIEAGTFMVAAAASGGDVLIKNVIPKHLESITEKLDRAGARIEEHDDFLRILRTGPLSPLSIKTLPHPGFPTDMQPQMAALLSLAGGTSIITEGIWPNRFRYTEELCRMGADIRVDGPVAVIQGVRELCGAPVKATDLRAGAAMLIAACCAKGVTEIEDIQHIERGYENIVEKFIGLGADIQKISFPQNIPLEPIGQIL